MSLIKKIIFILSFVFITLLISIYLLSKYFVLDEFLKINIDNANTNLQRTQEAFNDKFQFIIHAGADWAPWDDTYFYVQGKNENYISENINTNSLNNLGINYMVFTDKDNKLVHYEISDEIYNTKFSEDLINFIISNTQLFGHIGFDTDISGLMEYNGIPLIVSSHPIVTNEYKGPIAGSLIFIKIVDDEFINAISERVKLPVSKYSEGHINPGFTKINNLYIYNDKIIGIQTIKDINQNDSLKLAVEIPKSIYQQGYTSTIFFLAIFISIGFLLTLLLIFYLRHTVIKPIKKLTQASIEMSKGNLSVRTKNQAKDELGVLSSSFDSMAEKLQHLINEIEKSKESELHKTEEIIKLKDEFVYIAAHELKAPVTAISGFIEILKDYSTNSPPQIKENLDILSSASQRLENLLFDLLEISRAESGTLPVKLQPLDINSMIKQTTDQFTLKIKEKNITYKTELDETNHLVLADEIKLNEVLNNLISNAIKFNKNDGLLEIKTSVKENFLLIEVIDSGYGIPADIQPKVFDKFFRAVSNNMQDVEGTGLGLFITKMLVEKMGGEIGFTSKENEGSNFYFTLKKAA